MPINKRLSRRLIDGVKSTENTLSEQLYKLGSVVDHYTVSMMHVSGACS